MIQEFRVRNAMHVGISVVGWKRAFWRHRRVCKCNRSTSPAGRRGMNWHLKGVVAPGVALANIPI